MKNLRDFTIEIYKAAENEVPDTDFQNDYRLILQAEGQYQVKKMLESGKYTDADISNILRLGILKIPATLATYKEENRGDPIHPYRFEKIQPPLMIIRNDGTKEWIRYENKPIRKTAFCLGNISQYAHEKIPSIRQTERDTNIFNWLLAEIEKYQRQQNSSIIKAADPKDILLFTIDSTARAVENNEEVIDFFSINRYLNRGIELYKDKYNILHGAETI